MATDYSALKVTELKELLKERGIALTGLTRKQQYVEALEAQDAGTDEQIDDGGDHIIDDAPTDDATNGKADADAATKDEEKVNDTITPAADSAAPSEASTESRKRKRETPPPPKLDDTNQPESSTSMAGKTQSDDVAMMDVEEVESAPSIHPATRAIYISDLVRPLQPAQLRDHLESIAQSSTIQLFHLDALRTHAFAVFASTNAALRVRSRLHNTVWPEEPTRKPLWVDYVPEEKVQGWIDTEIGESGSRRDIKRWEVTYNTVQGGEVETEHREIGSGGSRDAGRQNNTSTGNGISNAPSGPRADRRPSAQEARRSPEQPDYAERATPERPNKSFNVLDERFNFTSSRPKIYFLPQPKEMVERRLRELDSQTSRDWASGRHAPQDPAAQLRRYTFDDGDVLVDGGPDFGNFGAPKNAPRRGGYGGGYRGGRR